MTPEEREKRRMAGFMAAHASGAARHWLSADLIEAKRRRKMMVEIDGKKLLETDPSVDALLEDKEKTDKYRRMLGLPEACEQTGASGNDSVHEEAGSWYFWDETQANRHGPYATEEACRAALEKYAKQLGE